MSFVQGKWVKRRGGDKDSQNGNKVKSGVEGVVNKNIAYCTLQTITFFDMLDIINRLEQNQIYCFKLPRLVSFTFHLL